MDLSKSIGIRYPILSSPRVPSPITLYPPVPMAYTAVRYHGRASSLCVDVCSNVSRLDCTGYCCCCCLLGTVRQEPGASSPAPTRAEWFSGGAECRVQSSAASGVRRLRTETHQTASRHEYESAVACLRLMTMRIRLSCLLQTRVT